MRAHGTILPDTVAPVDPAVGDVTPPLRPARPRMRRTNAQAPVEATSTELAAVREMLQVALDHLVQLHEEVAALRADLAASQKPARAPRSRKAAD